MGTKRRHLPADFASVAATLTNDALCTRYKAGVDVIQRWRRETGVTYNRTAAPKEAAPVDFAERARTMSMKEAQRVYKRSYETIARWFRECGFPTPEPIAKNREMPADFRAISPDMSVANLMVRYSAGRDLINRWIKETGVLRKLVRPAAVRTPPKAKPQPFVRSVPAKPKSSMLTRATTTSTVLRANRDMSRAGQAADFLKRFGGVWRCNPSGGPNPTGTHWRRGSAILTDADLIERAERLGWDADAWKRVA